MGQRPMRTCRLAFAVPVEANPAGSNSDASQGEGDGVEWRDVSCYATDDAGLVVHRNADDPSVYGLSHVPTGRSIPMEGIESPEPLIELANRLGRMTDWAALEVATGINGLPPGQEVDHRGAQLVQRRCQAGVGGRMEGGRGDGA